MDLLIVLVALVFALLLLCSNDVELLWALAAVACQASLFPWR
jgi:hypothetical protein